MNFLAARIKTIFLHSNYFLRQQGDVIELQLSLYDISIKSDERTRSQTVWQSDCLTSQHTPNTTIWYDSKMCANVSICSVFRPVLSCLIYTETEPISCITPHLDVEMKSSTKTQFFVSVTLPVFNLEWHPHWLHTMGWRGGGRQS